MSLAIPTQTVVQYGEAIAIAPVAVQGTDVLAARIPQGLAASSVSESSRVNGAISTITVNFTLNVDRPSAGGRPPARTLRGAGGCGS